MGYRCFLGVAGSKPDPKVQLQGKIWAKVPSRPVGNYLPRHDSATKADHWLDKEPLRKALGVGKIHNETEFGAFDRRNPRAIRGKAPPAVAFHVEPLIKQVWPERQFLEYPDRNGDSHASIDTPIVALAIVFGILRE